MVYVVQEPPNRRKPDNTMSKIDVTPAAKFGELKVLLPNADIVLSIAPTIRKLRVALKTFCDADYLLMIGDPVAIGLALTVATTINVGRAKVLRWDKRMMDYIPISVDMFPERER